MEHRFKIDYSLLLLYLTLIFLGWLNLYSAKYNTHFPSIFATGAEYGKQFIWILVALFLGIAILFLETLWIYRAVYAFYLFCLLLLLGVFFTDAVNGSRSWFKLPGLSFQPSELAKTATALVVARYLSAQSGGINNLGAKINTTLLIGLPALLILMQPDAGTFLVFFSFLLVLYREGLSGELLFSGIFCIVLAVLTLFLKDTTFNIDALDLYLPAKFVVVFSLVIISLMLRFINYRSLPPYQRRKEKPLGIFWFLFIGFCMLFVYTVEWSFENVLKAHQKDRINLLLGLIEDKSGVGYNMHRALSAIGSGGLEGRGYKQSLLANDEFKHVPEQGTDFIFCSIGEEWGFIGSSVVVALFVAFLLKILFLAERQRSKFVRIYAYSVCSILFFHFLINLGMVIGLLPVIGIPLPFFSYGGSSFLGFSLMVFVLLRLDGEKKIY
jgi:rod shape determining protein RodA